MVDFSNIYKCHHQFLRLFKFVFLFFQFHHKKFKIFYTHTHTQIVISAIRNKIFNGYDPMAHPVINHTHPISVRMKMRLLHFGLDSRQSLLNFHSYFRIEW